MSKQFFTKESGIMWFVFALLSAVFAALTSVLAKVGIEGVNSNLATALRTCVVLAMAWLMVFITHTQSGIGSIGRKSWVFLILSGLATGASWLCYYYAIQNGVVSIVVPIDKMSILLTFAFSYFVFGERLSRKAGIGLCLMTVGTLTMTCFG